MNNKAVTLVLRGFDLGLLSRGNKVRVETSTWAQASRRRGSRNPAVFAVAWASRGTVRSHLPTMTMNWLARNLSWATEARRAMSEARGGTLSGVSRSTV